MLRYDMKIFSNEYLQDYWGVMGHYTLPFLKDRPVTIEQVFNPKTHIYRRYADKNKKQLISIKNQLDILEKAHQYTYSFHPYICDPQLNKPWFVLDIDPKSDKISFKIVKRIAFLTSQALKKQNSNFLVKFCGNNGFHFIWQWVDYKNTEISEPRVYKVNKIIIYDAVINLIKNQSILDLINVKFSSAQQQKSLEKWCLTQKIKLNPKLPALVFDTKILHHHGNIRSPFSIHPKTGLVSTPLSVEKIKNFKKSQAQPEVVKKQKWDWVEIKKNRLRLIKQ